MARPNGPKKYEDLDFTDDFMFCKVLSSNPDLTKDLLETILGFKIRKIEFPIAQKAIEITADGRGIRLDIYVEDDASTVYDVEMQTTKQSSIGKRARYYQGLIDLNLIERGASFSALKKSFVIFICMNDPFGKGKQAYTFENLCVNDPSLTMGDEARKIFVNVEGDADNVSPDLKEFLQYLRNKAITGTLSRRIEDAVVRARNHEEWRTEYMTLLMRDEQMREEGREKGREERDREMIEKKLCKGWTPERIHEDDEYPMDLILEVQESILAKA